MRKRSKQVTTNSLPSTHQYFFHSCYSTNLLISTWCPSPWGLTSNLKISRWKGDSQCGISIIFRFPAVTLWRDVSHHFLERKWNHYCGNLPRKVDDYWTLPKKKQTKPKQPKENKTKRNKTQNITKHPSFQTLHFSTISDSPRCLRFDWL